MGRSKLIREIRSKLIAAVDTETIDWVKLEVVGELAKNQTLPTGFAYDRDGNREPVTASDSEVYELLMALRDTMAEAENGPRWRSTLIRVDRDTGEINFEFHYDDKDRWTEWPHSGRPKN